MSEQNKATVRRYLEEVWNKGNMTTRNEIISTSYVGHVPGGDDIEGLEALKNWVTSSRNAFPDGRFKLENQIAEKDMVVIVWTMSGTQKGEFQGVSATGKHFSSPGVSVTRLSEGKLVENWGYWDQLSFLKQLGVIQI